MKIKLKKVTAILLLTGLFVSCKNALNTKIDEPENVQQTDASSIQNNEKTTLLVSADFSKEVLQKNADSLGRTLFPFVETTDLINIVLSYGPKGGASSSKEILKTWNEYNDIDVVEVEEGNYDFVLTAKCGLLIYSQTVTKTIEAGTNSINFTLDIESIDCSNGTGTFALSLSFPHSENVKNVLGWLYDDKGTIVTGYNGVYLFEDMIIGTETDSVLFETGTKTTQALAAGEYTAKIGIYADDFAYQEIGNYSESIIISDDAESSASRAISSLDEVYTITWHLDPYTSWVENFIPETKFTRIGIPDAFMPDDSYLSRPDYRLATGPDGCFFADAAYTIPLELTAKDTDIYVKMELNSIPIEDLSDYLSKLPDNTSSSFEPYKIIITEPNPDLNELKNILKSFCTSYSATRKIDLNLGYTEITSIPEKAFYQVYSLTGIKLPQTVTTIGNNAFYDCSNLTYIDLPDEIESIGSKAFQYCKKLQSVTLPKGLTTIQSSLFYNCTALSHVDIPSTVETIDTSAFSYCESLTEITLPASITNITNGGDFSNLFTLTGLEIINFDSEHPDFCSIDGVVFNKDKTKLVYCPPQKAGSYTIPESVTTIGIWGFLNNKKLTSISMSNNVTTLEDYAFESCSALTDITLSTAITSIPYYCFDNCDSLTEFTIPSNIKTIVTRAFNDCNNLQTVTFSEGNTIVHAYCFYGCNKLTHVYLSDTITEIDDNAFENCTSLEVFYITKSVSRIGESVFNGCNALTFVQFADTTNWYYRTSQEDFYGNEKGTLLKTDDFELNARWLINARDLCLHKVNAYKIEYKFNQQPQFTYSKPDITVFEPGVTTQTTIPSPSFSSDDYDFGGWYTSSDYQEKIIEYPNGPEVDYSEDIELYALFELKVEYSFYDLMYEITSLEPKSQPYKIIIKNDNYDDYSFKELTKTLKLATNIKIDLDLSNLTDIDVILEEQFKGFKNLTNVTLPQTSKTYGIQKSEFEECSLTSITIPNCVVSIAPNAFKNSELNSIVIPSSVVIINSNAFEGTQLTSITLPNTINIIKDSIFKNCTSLTKVFIDCSIDNIPSSTFEGCTALETITIPATCEKINESAFENCSSLTQITIPQKVTNIDKNAFAGCSSLSKVTFIDTTNWYYTSDESIAENKDYLNATQFDAATINGDIASLNTDNYFFKTDSYPVIYNLNGGTISNDAPTTYTKDSNIPLPVPTKEGFIFGGWHTNSYINVYNEITEFPEDNYRYTSSTPLNLYAKWIDLNNLQYSDVSTILATKTAADNPVTIILKDTSSYYTDFDYVIHALKDTLDKKPDVLINLDLSGCSNLTEIDYEQFDDIDNLKSIILPSSVKDIGFSAFGGCSKLESITLQEGLTSIQERAFDGCTALTSITIPTTVTDIYNNAFENCDSLESIVLPSNLLFVSFSVFYDCDNLKTVTINCNGGLMQDSCFASCSNLKEVHLGENIGTIPERIFENCTALEKVNQDENGINHIPEGVKEICSYAFKNTAITNIELPSSLKIINKEAFADTKLTGNITLPENVEKIGSNVFSYQNGIDKVSYNAIIFENYDTLKSTYKWISLDPSRYDDWIGIYCDEPETYNTLTIIEDDVDFSNSATNKTSFTCPNNSCYYYYFRVPRELSE